MSDEQKADVVGAPVAAPEEPTPEAEEKPVEAVVPAEPEPEPEAKAEPEPKEAVPEPEPKVPEPEPEPEPEAEASPGHGGAAVSGDPGFIKVTVDQTGKVGMWTAKPNSILHMHSDEPTRPAQVTVTGATAGFTFGSRSASGELSEVKGDSFELFAEDGKAVLSTGGGTVASFDAEGNARVPGKVHAESFETTSSRAAKTNIESLQAEQAYKVLAGLDSVCFEFKRSGAKHVGFIAEDVPDEVANSEHTAVKMMDIVSVLACCVKDQHETIQRLTERIAALENKGK
mmetsp:Transcript_25950/g.76062  ORF Transcript_25950/g.76062 Transcript_25950/m.76062 type:complete len:286 (-) Transcript_25950:540-1397(-)